ncbi:MAG TPA: type IV pilus modification protein PilV [Rhodanobacteraceae bacterium]
MFRSAPASAVRGVSMIEVLVAIVVFSIGLLGIALMQVRGATFTKDSGARSMAVVQARSLADRMQANPTGVADDDYVWNSATQGIPGYTDCSSVTCSPKQVANNDINAWLNQMTAAMPQSSSNKALGLVVNNADGTYTITVQWNGLNIIDKNDDTVSDSFVYVPRAGG